VHDGSADLQHVRRQIRVVAILDAAERVGLIPLATQPLHTIAYFADALAPVWGLRILDAQLLKRREGPLSPTFQRDVDALVGLGIVVPRNVSYVFDDDGNCRLHASYSLNTSFADRILHRAEGLPSQTEELSFIREVVFAVSGLGAQELSTASSSDATYGDALVDFGAILDLAASNRKPNPSVRVALRFGELMQPKLRLSDAEMIHLYVRELYRRLSNAA
jgi:hypothetical protein